MAVNCDTECRRLCEYYVFVCRIWGFLTALTACMDILIVIVLGAASIRLQGQKRLWGVGVETVYFQHYIGVGIIIVAVIVSLLESVILLTYFSDVDFKCKCSCWKCYEFLLCIDDWRKGLLYLILSIVCFVRGHIVWLPLISGCILVVCALLYTIKTIKTRKDTKKDFLFTANSTHENYDEISEIVDEIGDDSIINPTGTMPSMSVAEQSDILEV